MMLWHLSGIGFALFVNNVDRDYEAGIDMVDRAIRSNPNYAVRHIFPEDFLRVWDGGSDTAIADFEQSIRFSPRDPLFLHYDDRNCFWSL